ncbi:hypothetical protein REISMN_03505 [Rickettsia tamurae subsp. buchneri]|uniref:Uncharacterized protein n=1 Tax=Rickettsia tamurae subsp. buchneri TaxID=1462938 RepID=A0A8E0WM14_9RICK|nr:hypothetical protein REISMN_03505 [Rickettsia tamurae subsp. buchneri]
MPNASSDIVQKIESKIILNNVSFVLIEELNS